MKKPSFLIALLDFSFSGKHTFDVLRGTDEPENSTFKAFISLQADEDQKKKIAAAAFDKSWEILKFETENYWRRATYFWAFQIAAFAGYFTILSSDKFRSTTITYALYFDICVGFITSFAWLLTNKGSKQWQNHWVGHIMLLEEEITGPLLRVEKKRRISVTNVNEIVSWFITTLWLVFAIEYFNENVTLVYTTYKNIDWPVWLSSFTTLYFASALYFGYGRPNPVQEKKPMTPAEEKQPPQEPVPLPVQL